MTSLVVTSNTFRQITAALGIQRANCLHPLSDRYPIEEDAYQCLGPSPFKDLVTYCRACGDEVGRVAAHSSQTQDNAHMKKMTLAQSIARQIRAWRNEGACSQKWLADRSRTPQSAVSRVESGKHLPTLKTLQRLAKPMHADVVVTLVRRDRTPLDGDLVDRVACAICDSHPDYGRGYRWADWIKQSMDKSAKPFEREMAQEWMDARRNEARAAILILQQTSGACPTCKKHVPSPCVARQNTVECPHLEGDTK